MSMKRILGTMLASRMAGRGHSKGALGSSAALGLLGARRPRRRGLGSKLGVAALGYMAYQAYQSSQSSQSHAQSQHGATGTASSTGSHGASGSSGLIDKIRDKANEFLNAGPSSATSQGDGRAEAAAPDQDLREAEDAAERFSDDEALLMIRAMITAAYADGALSQEERARIVQAIGDADATPEERATMEREIANPKPLDELLTEVNDEETAEEFYLASRAAVDGHGEQERRYLEDLRTRLGLSEEDAADVEAIAT
ncbi:DUF533 domain-containing protein [Roseivivax sediminis]|uniref:Uncharacterized membrane protein YebE, DUF533 family n=1 Tax=Roseivivax sediminis TaxID=936889 RepID=A0A1I1SXY7_9RHOB|nr:DUF533 domain-containing protein [Roseivivax sediminis]SFD49638.1 Uncharacterized membrane protein YebE, DUF533 family [Roseivivax sediminis]